MTSLTATSSGSPRSYRSVFIPEHGFTVYFPALFKTVHEYTYGPHGRLNTEPEPR
ncbi:hypothetical protein [Salinispora pacifica]|uniref:hypothetical protein n=1 Tax=Salinispora pacifica TaxID=351187 RepID=UPI001E378AD8|nr:hypothetical protein [Salinispora pacifica]